MALAFLILPHFICNYWPTLISLFINMAFFGLVSGGQIPIAGDMSKDYPATVYSIANTVAAASGFLAPQIASFYLNMDLDFHQQWTWIFTTAAINSIIGGTAFLLFASAKPIKFK